MLAPLQGDKRLGYLSRMDLIVSKEPDTRSLVILVVSVQMLEGHVSESLRRSASDGLLVQGEGGDTRDHNIVRPDGEQVLLARPDGLSSGPVGVV